MYIKSEPLKCGHLADLAPAVSLLIQTHSGHFGDKFVGSTNNKKLKAGYSTTSTLELLYTVSPLVASMCFTCEVIGHITGSEITGSHRPFSVHFSHMTKQNLTCLAVMAT